MAADEALFLSAEDNCAGGTLRVYQADDVSMTIGCFQKISGLDTDFLRKRDIKYVRRITGGRTVLHGDDITFSFVADARSPLYAGSITGITAAFSKIVQKFLRSISIDVSVSTKTNLDRETTDAFCFNTYTKNELLVNDKKIVGFALKRTDDSFLLQGSIPVKLDHDLLRKIFCAGSHATDGGSVTCIQECLSDVPDFGSLKDAFLDAFKGDGFALKEGALSDKESAAAKRLITEKYSSPKWNDNPSGKVYL